MRRQPAIYAKGTRVSHSGLPISARFVWTAVALAALTATACTNKNKPATQPAAAEAGAPKAVESPSASPATAVDPQAELMKAGLESLYQKADYQAAAAQFRNVLTLNPTHYGARYQLAMALERAGDPTAKAEWQKVLDAATAISDQQTAADARAHLGK
jgi:hypothetical protein